MGMDVVFLTRIIPLIELKDVRVKLLKFDSVVAVVIHEWFAYSAVSINVRLSMVVAIEMAVPLIDEMVLESKVILCALAPI